MSAYQALYRKYRPQTFDDVVGQNAVTQTLKTQIVSGKLSHAYLFTGCHGTGKTTCAKILAKAVNCLNPENGNPCNRCKACRAIDEGTCMDVLEIDAASNNGVDNVRDLRDDAVYSPSQVKKRVYIVDEVHMLSTSAFNALLKIIEEPPEHLLFILATTELHKVPATILSRCQRFSFRRIGQEDIAAQLQFVAYQENIDLDHSAARVLARLADGAMRDALSLLDQCASAVSGELTAERVYACLGIAGERRCAELLDKIARQDTAGAMQLFNRLYTEGKDLSAMLDELASLVRDVLILKTAPEAGITMLSGVAEDGETRALASRISGGELIRMMELLQKTLNLFTRSASRRTDAELCILEMSQPELSQDLSSMNARLTRVEEQLKTGAFVMPQRAAPAPQEKTEAEPEPSDESGVSQPEPEPVREVNEELPMGFWQDLAAAVRKELYPPVSGFFTATPNGPMEVEVSGSVLTLRCRDSFTAEIVGKEDILQVVSRKASVLLGKPVKAKVTDLSKQGRDGAGMSKLMRFGRANPDIVRIKEN
ncbi:MAG: DNA polymerase III subunit gamma/tau [Clostridiales bacterium]|nr:DNA polymerase III subunit gamma/tau [Clostridiales bacterium]MCI7573484.1 DNA polymerase III subunit gamma/tau [Clostridiales bacterium]MDY5642262.1 DNA polymerase III subunit gamma/tau [Candidatus Faecousia sp.]